MFSLGSVIIFGLIITVSVAKTMTGSIGFPESEENPDFVNKDHRQPVYIPSMCPVGELYYPGDQKDDWICDCRPSFLYHPKTDTCWPAYKQGPCADEYYLVLGEESAIPFCEKNPCHLDNHVMYNGRCEILGTITPCRSSWPRLEALAVNSTTLNIGCERLSLESRFSDNAPIVQLNTCPAGGKGSIRGKCSPPKVTTTPAPK